MSLSAEKPYAIGIEAVAGLCHFLRYAHGDFEEGARALASVGCIVEKITRHQAKAHKGGRGDA